MHSRPVMGDYHQPRAIGAEGGSSFHQCTRVWGLEPSDRAARLGLDEAKDLVRLLNQQMAPVGGEGVPFAPHPQRLVPGADGPEPARGRTRHQPFPIGAEGDTDKPLDLQIGDPPAIGDPPDLGAVLAVAAGRQPLTVRADRDIAAVIQRAHRERSTWRQDMGDMKIRCGHDST